LALAGCAQTAPPRSNTPDPLTGGAPLPSVVPPPVPVGSTPTPAGGPPPVPVATSTPSTAALVNGGPSKPLSGGHDLRIGEGPAQLTGATLRAPQPVTPALRTEAVPMSFGSGARVTGYEQAQAILQSRGVKWQKLETVSETGDWKFSCLVPNPRSPNSVKTYEAQASSYLAAVQAVLDKMDRD